MSERITKKHVEGALDVVLKYLGERKATAWNDVGAFRLEHGPNNRYVVEKILDKGVTRPFGDTLRTAEDMYYTLHFALNVLDYLDRKKGKYE